MATSSPRTTIGEDTQQAEIEATGIPPSDDRESAIVETLAPGAYTAIVRGKNDTTGVALVEAYRLGDPTPTPSPTPTATNPDTNRNIQRRHRPNRQRRLHAKPDSSCKIQFALFACNGGHRGCHRA